MDRTEKQGTKVFLETSLQSFFYTELQGFNEKLMEPLPNEAIYYSSLVMDKFGETKKYFETSTEGRIRNKILGTKLLRVSGLKGEEKKRELKDIADTALLICGFFSESLSKKIIDIGYYQDLGQIAYRQLDSIVPVAYDIPSFFDVISLQFDRLVTVMGLVSQKTFAHDFGIDSSYLIVGKKLAS